MSRPHATLAESQRRGHAKQVGRLREVDRFPCGCEQTAANTVTRYGRDYCRRCRGSKFPRPSQAVAVGRRFGMLVVTKVFASGQKASCRCDCGKSTEAWTGNLQKGSTASCGCTQGTHKFTPTTCALAKLWP